MDAKGSYDRVAAAYAAQFLDELAHKPLDRALLDAFAELTRGSGTVLDVGCGPGHVGRYLADRGARVHGVDLSERMIEEARRAHPAMTFSVGDFHALPFDDGSHAGAVAFYSLIHARPERLPDVARELARVIAPGGHLLVAFQASGDVVHLDEWLGEPVDLDFHLFETAQVQAALEGAGFELTARLERAAYATERPLWRGYLLASRP